MEASLSSRGSVARSRWSGPFANDASGASQTEVLQGRYDSSPGPARNERRPGSGAEDDLLPFFRVCRAARGRAKPEKGEGDYGLAFTQGGCLCGLALGYYHAAPVGRLPVASFVG